MKINLFRTAAYSMMIFSVGLALWYLILGGYFHGSFTNPDSAKAIKIQPFIAGLVLPLLTIGSTLLVIETLRTNTFQNFSSNFFKLIDQHHKLVDNIFSEVEGITTGDKPSKARELFDDLSLRVAHDYSCLTDLTLKEEYPIGEDLKEEARGKIGKDLLVSIYDYYFHLHQSDLGHYFRNLFHIVRFVDRSSLREKDKKEYLKMLRAQMSNYELLLLGYNGLHPYGKEFYPLIEKYQLLKSLNSERKLANSYKKRIIDIDVLINAYPHLDHWSK